MQAAGLLFSTREWLSEVKQLVKIPAKSIITERCLLLASLKEARVVKWIGLFALTGVGQLASHSSVDQSVSQSIGQSISPCSSPVLEE